MNVTVPSGTHVVYVSVTSNNRTDFIQMDRLTETTYTKTIITSDVEEIEYKYCAGPDLRYEELHSDGSQMSNRILADPVSNDIVALWEKVYSPEITGGAFGENLTWTLLDDTLMISGKGAIPDFFPGWCAMGILQEFCYKWHYR